MPRPRLDSADDTAKVTLRMASRLQERVDALALREGMASAAWMRRAIEEAADLAEAISPSRAPSLLDAAGEGEDRVGATTQSIDPPSRPEPDEKPPTIPKPAAIPAAAKTAVDTAAQLAERARKREAEHRHRPVARKGSTISGCAECPMLLVGGNWIQPEAADVPEDEEW